MGFWYERLIDMKVDMTLIESQIFAIFIEYHILIVSPLESPYPYMEFHGYPH